MNLLIRKLKNIHYRRICISLFWIVTTVYTQSTNSQVILVNNEIDQHEVYAIIQDQKGFIWFGTETGLVRYDGYNYTYFYNNPNDPLTISHNNIRCLLEDTKGMIWIGTRGGGLNKFDPLTENFTKYIFQADNPNSISNDYLNSICEDSSGFLWVGTDQGLNRFDPEEERFIRFLYNDNDSNSLSHNDVNSICVDSRGNLWIGTLGGGLNKLVLNDKEGSPLIFKHYKNDPENPNSLSWDRVWSVFVSRSGIVWVATEGGGVNKFDPLNERFTRYLHSENQSNSLRYNSVRPIIEDKSGKIWFGTEQGLDQFNPVDERFIHYLFQEGTKVVDPIFIYNLFIDRTGILWIGFQEGAYKFNPGNDNFRHYGFAESDPNYENLKDVKSLFIDRSGIVWIGTDNGILGRYNPQNDKFIFYMYHPDNPADVRHSMIKSISQDKSGNIWLGTWGDGVSVFDPSTEKFTNYKHHEDDPNSLANNEVWAVYKDRSDDIWVGMKNSVDKFDPITNGFVHILDQIISVNILSHNYIRKIYEDNSGIFWIGSRYGLLKYEPGTKELISYHNEVGNPNSISDNDFASLVIDDAGTLWIGTLNGLNQFDPVKETFTNYTTKEGLPRNVIRGVLRDDVGNLLLSTWRGISSFNPKTKKFRNYGNEDGLKDITFLRKSCLENTITGEMYFGGIKGFVRFHPDSLSENPYPPPIVVTDFKVLNKSVKIDQNNKPVRAENSKSTGYSILRTDKINLTYAENIMTFEFAALDYNAPEKNQYAYMLEGFDLDWIFTDAKKRFATYTNLDPGGYVFWVKGSNNDVIWNETGISLAITITPPIWKTWWAYIIYTMVLGSVIFGIIRFEINRERLKNQLKLQNLESLKLQEMDQMKSQFFANISHEFRTPLTLIRSPLEDLLKGGRKFSLKSGRKKLNLSLRNVKQIQQLIEQLLDLSKLEAGKLSLHTRRYDLISFLSRIIDTFSLLSQKCGINLKFETDSSVVELYYDEEKLEKVMNNLISNALSFTPEGGEVTIYVKDAKPESRAGADDASVTIIISDTGQGIPPEALPRIFDRFYQVDGSMIRTHEGTGIGLALVKEFVELHKGKIFVESKLGSGTTFRLILLKGKTHLSAEELITEVKPARYEPRIDTDEERQADQPVEPPEISLSGFSGTILIVEDNDDLRGYLGEYLSPPFRIVEANNGKQGYQKARKALPDLIISDIMMPQMDGITFCQKIRQDDVLRNVPVILLTAKADEKDRLIGLKIKADDYITKPFNAAELKLKIHNLVERRQKIWAEFSEKMLASQTDQVQLDSVDKIFLEQIRNVVEKHISDSDFNVDILAGEIFLGRRQLYRKLNDLTGLTPAEFIRRIRLLRAKQLIDKRAMSTVSEVARAVGFSKVRYFSLLFRNTFGQTPGDLIRE